jgi:RNA polymerase sigma-70 factor (ECF subfamily)
MTFFRRRSIRPEGHVATLSEEELYNIASDLDVLRDVERKEMKQLLTRALEILPEKYREVLFLQYFEDKSYDEISDILRIPLGTVGVRLNRAKSKLVDILQTQGYTYDN